MLKIAITALLLCVAAPAAEVSLTFADGAFKVHGWPADRGAPAGGWDSLFAVYAGAGDVPMMGGYAVESGSLVFRPRFPLAAGVRYRAVFHASGSTAEKIFDGPAAETSATTRVKQVYPSTDVLPSNQLKFYIYFTAPMGRGDAWHRMRLLDQNGAAVELPFLEVQQELWDRDYERLTVLFDPGRIKRGLVPTNEIGPPIVEGREYTFVIDRAWTDARGVALAEGFRKHFRVGPADRNPPDAKNWRITAPKQGTVDPVVIDFGKPMDYALLTRLVELRGVRGRAAIAKNESEWRFTPEQPWKAGDYSVVVDTALEDLSGNRVGRAFDVDKFDRVSERIERKTVSLPLRIR